MSYHYSEDEAVADPEILALGKGLQALVSEISGPFRKSEFTTVLQQFDMLMASPVVEEVAARALDCREETRVLDALGSSLNVLDPDFLHWRLTTAQGRLIGVEGNYALPRPTNVSANAYHLFEMEHRTEEVWGQALLAAMRLMPDEQEHHEEIVSDYERLFERCSDYLRALLQDANDAIHLLDATIVDPSEVSAQYVVSAALLKHPPSDMDALATLVAYMRQRSIPLSIAAAEHMERIYTRFMKGPAVGDVFRQVTSVGIIPLSARPFAMLFNNLTDSNAVLDAYDLMLDYGIAPEASTLRILCKQSRMEYAKLHFTTVLKNKANIDAAAAGGTATNSLSQTPSPSPPPRSPVATLGGGAAANTNNSNNSNTTSASASAAAAAHAASWRRDERSYFAQRIGDMIEKDPNVPLLEALKVLHRAEVEGTSLQGDTYILSALLRHYCRGITPRSLLILPFSASPAYGPSRVADDVRATTAAAAAAAAAGGDGRAGDRGPSLKKFEVTNAFQFGLNDAEDDLLEAEEECTIHDETMQLPSGVEGRRGEHDGGERGRRTQRPPPRDPFIADSAEEGEYIVEVLKSYGSYPDNSVLQTLSAQYEGRVPEMEIVAKAADAFFEGCMASQGTMEPVNCRILHALAYHYIDNRWRERAHQLLCKVLEMYHAYQVVFHADLGGTEKWFCYFAVIVGTKTGPLDLGIGLYTVALALGDRLVNPKVPAKLTAKRDSSENVTEVIEELKRCGWDRNRILCSDALMLEPQERAQADGEMNGGGKPSDNGAGSLYGMPGDVGRDSIYTNTAQGPSSFTNAHLLSARPSLGTYMSVTLRELGVEKATMNWLRDKLRAARQEALATAAVASH